MTQTVIVGLSGGVDSAVSAWLLQQQGYRVSAVFMRNWDDDGGKYCTAQQDFLDACQVAEHLGIELAVANFTAEYKEKVFSQCLKLLKQGMTPNPDVWCNSQIKFGAFLDYVADRADLIATGHYARLRRDGDGVTHLLRARDERKDQSYFLHQLNQHQLSHCLFPLGEWHKTDVRAKAMEIGLSNFNRPDSTGICFIGERPFAEFLREHLPEEQGEMVDPQGKVVGQHQGLAFYTLGQRKGLGIGGSKNGNGEAWYVAGKDLERNQLVVVQGEDHPLLYGREVRVCPMHWINEKMDRKNLARDKVFATIRYRQAPMTCSAVFEEWDEESAACVLGVRFAEPQKAVTPGQFAVLYQGDECVGGGVIARPR